MLICSEGHILQGYRKETIEQTEMSQHVMRKRALKRTRQEVKTRRPGNLAHYHGSRARFLYLQSLQLLLRLQIAALQELWSLPKEFESICKDVWALHLTMLPNPIEADLPDEPTDFRALNEPPSEEEKDDSSDSKSPTHSSGEEEGDVDLDPQGDLAQLLNGISEASSDSDESASEKAVAAPRKSSARKRDHANPVANIAVLIVSCWIMRVPVIYMDLVRLIRDYMLPYLDPVRRGLIPQQMVMHMKRDVINWLSPLGPPRPLQLHHIASRLAHGMTAKYRIVLPEANAPHILTRAMSALHLPAAFYPMTKILASKLSISLNLHPFAGEDLSTARRGRIIQNGDNIPVEMAFICVLILLLKLIYRLDDSERVQFLEEDMVLNLPIKEDFLSPLRRDRKQAESLERRTAMDFSDKEIDEYLAFAERALLGENTEGLQRQPTPAAPTQSESEETTAMLVDDDEGPSPDYEPLPRGKNHTIYITNDILGLLPEEYQLVISKAARWCGVEDNDIANIVERYERRLLRQMEKGKKTKSRERLDSEED